MTDREKKQFLMRYEELERMKEQREKDWERSVQGRKRLPHPVRNRDMRIQTSSALREI
jgi:hypothetical protein